MQEISKTNFKKYLEAKAKPKKKNAFLKRVLSGEKIFIKGDEDVLSKIVKGRKN